MKGVKLGRDALMDHIRHQFGPEFTFRPEVVTAARSGAPTDLEPLRLMLSYLQYQKADLVWRHLAEDWSGLHLDELVARHTREVAVDEMTMPPSAARPIDGGPYRMIGNLMSWIPMVGVRPLLPSQCADAAKSLALIAGDLSREGPRLLDADHSRRQGIDTIGLSLGEIEEMMRSWIAYHPESIWFKQHHRDPDKNLLSMVMPIDDVTKRRFIEGELDDTEIANGRVHAPSTCVLLTGAGGDFRHKLPFAQVQVMQMVLQHISSLTKPIEDHGLQVLCFESCPRGAARLERWGFEKTGGTMKRTYFPIIEMKLESRLAAHHDSKARQNMWNLFAAFQSRARNRISRS